MISIGSRYAEALSNGELHTKGWFKNVGIKKYIEWGQAVSDFPYTHSF